MLLQKYNHPIGCKLFQYTQAYAGPVFFRKQFHIKDKSKDFVGSVIDYYMYISSYGAWPLEIGEVTEDRVVVYFDRCTVKLEDQPDLCLAATAM